MTSLSGKLPSGDGNGLNAIVSELIDAPKTMHVAICIVDTRKVTTDADTGEVNPTVRIRRIEVVTEAEDLKHAEIIMRRALDQRTGRETLPYDLDAELRGIFDAPQEPEPGE